MKKIICLSIIISICLSSCSSTPTSSSDTVTETQEITVTEASDVSTEQVIEKVTETEIPPAPTTEPPTEPEVNELLFNDQGIEIYYQGIDQNTIKLCIINPSNELPVHAWIQDVSVNGIFLENVGCEGYAPNCGSNSWTGVLSLEELQNNNISRINELKFTFLIYLGNQLIYNDKEEITITR